MITHANIWANLKDLGNNDVWDPLVGDTAPVDGTSGTGAGLAGPGSRYLNNSGKHVYFNIGTKASPTWAHSGSVTDIVITSAQVLALNATPITIVAAPGVGRVVIFEGAMIEKPAGTAYAAVAAGEDLSIRYTDGSGLEVGEAEATGFLDQATNQIRLVLPYHAASGVSQITPVANAPLVLHMLSGEITTGTSPLNLRVFYRIYKSAF